MAIVGPPQRGLLPAPQQRAATGPPPDLWRAYTQLTEAETAFRIHKSDLSLRPVWHQKKERVQAHVLVCFLAYVLWKTLGSDVQVRRARRRTAQGAGRTLRRSRPWT